MKKLLLLLIGAFIANARCEQLLHFGKGSSFPNASLHCIVFCTDGKNVNQTEKLHIPNPNHKSLSMTWECTGEYHPMSLLCSINTGDGRDDVGSFSIEGLFPYVFPPSRQSDVLM